MTITNGSTMATCPKNPKHRTSIVVNDGQVDASHLRYKEEDDDSGQQDGPDSAAS